LNAGWNDELLGIELAALQQEDFDLALIGFEDEELTRLLASQDAAEGPTDEDSIPNYQRRPFARPVIFGSWAIINSL
jgi:hypothetical protein